MSSPASYRGRIAPSPTGLLHLGHAATFWIAYQRAITARGTLVLRMEDLDLQRSKVEFATAAIEDLRWLGIRWQEGSDVGGSYAPYDQSQRQAFYLSALRKLIEGRLVYPCTCSRKDLAQMAQAPHDDEPLYPGTCRPTTSTGISSPLDESRINWRFRVHDGELVEFVDGHFGPQRFTAGEDFGDFLVWRKDGVSAYQLAVTVDDAAMGITEVVRGEDLLKATARQILLCRALGLPEPLWHHCPLVRDAEGQRLAKRQDALSLRALRASGKEPDFVLKMAVAGPFDWPETDRAQRGPDL